ncbi:hypothetical protein KDA00_03820 [Candidatus Saccharibacteria bacterium]|nr:hypothetical protein [Candidatus Saccharibacteria bacterium]
MILTLRKLGIGIALLTLVIGLTLPGFTSAERRHHNNHDEYNSEQQCRDEESEETVIVPLEGVQEFSYQNNRRNNNRKPICATAEPATFDPSACGELGSYTIVESTGVDYTINGEIVAPGTYEVPNGTTVTIIAVAQNGYAFEDDAITEWTYTYNAPTDCDESQVLAASTPQVTVTPVGPVHAGAGGGSSINATPVAGLVVSMLITATGLVRKFTL